MLGAATAWPVAAQSLQPGQTWHFRLIHASSYVSDCLPCGLVTPPVPLRGGFDLILAGQTPISTTYLLTNIDWAAGDATGPQSRITGQGTWKTGGEVAVTQTLALELTVQTAGVSVTRSFTNTSPRANFSWPILDTEVFDTAGAVSRYELHLSAEPFREIWFATTTGMTPSNGSPDVNAGDIVSENGRIVESQADLMASFGSPAGDFRVDAFDVVPGGTFVFSLNQDLTNSPFGPLQNGDLLAEHGGGAATNQELLAAFGFPPGSPDLGLNGVQVMDDGSILFSINKDAVAPSNGVSITHGDVLSNRGEVVNSNAELLASFQTLPTGNLGLTTFHVWPSGEVWFSVETGFTDQSLGQIESGDLISSERLIVFKNSEMVGAFAPQDGVTNHGLSGLFVVSDVANPAPPPRLAAPVEAEATGDVILGWKGLGRVFQARKSGDLSIAFSPASPIVPGSSWVDAGAALVETNAFYSLRQW
jgi:hypothetical protein